MYATKAAVQSCGLLKVFVPCFYNAGKWVDVPPMPGTFIVNLADMLARWTNGKYKSSLHRVNKTVNRERFATAFFVNPNYDAVVSSFFKYSTT